MKALMRFVLVFSGLFFGSILVSATETNAYSAFGFARQALGQEIYGTAISNGLFALDAVMQNVRDKMIGFLPEPSGFTSYDTNDYYAFSDDNGSFNVSVKVEKAYRSNGDNLKLGRTLRASLDSSIMEMERWDGYALAWDSLDEHGSYMRISNRIRTNDMFSILDGSVAYVPIRIAETNDSVVSGVLLIVTMDLDSKADTNERAKTAAVILQDFLGKLPLKSMRWFLQ
jgi:hypothetical protein